MAIEASLQIDPLLVSDDTSVAIIGARLVNMGASLISWQPDMNRRPAIGRFKFPTEEARNTFVAEAVQIPGVTLLTKPVAEVFYIGGARSQPLN
jgi:hypothetical protein